MRRLAHGAAAMAASPAVIQDAPKAVYTHSDGSVLSIQYPSITMTENAGAAQLIAQYFADEQQQAKTFSTSRAIKASN